MKKRISTSLNYPKRPALKPKPEEFCEVCGVKLVRHQPHAPGLSDLLKHLHLHHERNETPCRLT